MQMAGGLRTGGGGRSLSRHPWPDPWRGLGPVGQSVASAHTSRRTWKSSDSQPPKEPVSQPQTQESNAQV